MLSQPPARCCACGSERGARRRCFKGVSRVKNGVPLEEAGQEEAALLALRRLQREELPPGSKVVEEELSYTGEGAARRLKALCRCEEEIGLVRKISVE